jgi:hypothetical protein
MASNDNDHIADAVTHGTYNDEADWDAMPTPNDPHSIAYQSSAWMCKRVVEEADHQQEDSAQVDGKHFPRS